MPEIDRRTFVALAANAVLASSLPVAVAPPDGLSPVIAARRHAMHEALAEFEIAWSRAQALWKRCDVAGIVADEGFADWYDGQPSTIASKAAWDRACAAVETLFMTPPQTMQDDDAIMAALEAYPARSAFAAQTARDLFTPARYRIGSAEAHASIREGLLTDPEEAFKVEMPQFLRALRARAARS